MPAVRRLLQTTFFMIALTFEQIKNGYELVIENGLRLLHASMTLIYDFPEQALGLAQLGQEEIGKSLSLLAAFSLPPDPDAWRWLWGDWRNHNLKAYRAFMYELIDPYRIELTAKDGTKYVGLPLRAKISQEKEFSFYVNFDEHAGSFVAPNSTVTQGEVFNRVFTLLYLGMAADDIKTVLTEENERDRIIAFSPIVVRICTGTLYQQDMPAILDKFAESSCEGKAIVDGIRTASKQRQELLSQMIEQAKKNNEDKSTSTSV